jgi:hypothetical protein
MQPLTGYCTQVFKNFEPYCTILLLNHRGKSCGMLILNLHIYRHTIILYLPFMFHLTSAVYMIKLF